MTTPTMPASAVPDDLVFYKVPEVMRILRMSKHQVYDQINAGRLEILKQGRSTVVPLTSLRAYVKLLHREAREAR